MTFNGKMIQERSILIPITRVTLRIAQQFAEQQLSEEKKEQVYLNTLAVHAVNDYMQMMDIPCDLSASESWSPAMRLYADVADLKLPQLGHLECRAIRSDSMCYLPLEVPEDRIGVVAVKIDTEHQEAMLLGFTQVVRSGELSLDQLQPIDSLLEHIDRLETKRGKVTLSQWLQNIYDANWLSVSEILALKEPALAFRYKSKATRAKLVELGIHKLGQVVALIVTLAPRTSTEIQIKMQVYPADEQAYLPENLVVKVLDEAGTSVMSAHAKTANTHIILELSAQVGESFSLSLELGSTNITENFIV